MSNKLLPPSAYVVLWRVMFILASLTLATSLLMLGCEQQSIITPTVTQMTVDKPPVKSAALRAVNKSREKMQPRKKINGLAAVVLDAKFKPQPELLKAAGPSYHGDLDEIRQRKILRVLVTYSRMDFFFNNGQIHGVQAGFFREFEKQLNVDIQDPAEQTRVLFLPVTFDQLIPSLTAGLGDVAAAFLTNTPERALQVDFAIGNLVPIEEIVVSHASAGNINTLADLAGKTIYVLRNSSYKEHLEILNKLIDEVNLEAIDIVEADASLLSEDLLELVNAGILPLTVVDQYRAELWAKIMPDLIVHKDIHIRKATNVGWAIRKDSPLLKAELNRFIESQGKGKLLGNMLLGEYVSNPRWIKNPTTQGERDRLNKYLPLFRKYGKKYALDELAIAAQAYQESGLEHGHESSKGAVGIMQVMPSTANDKNVSIAEIDDLEQNIHAGTKYLAFLRDHYYADSNLTESNRQAFIWASYNAGPAKVKNMRKLAQEMGLNPNIWFRNVELAASRIVGRETVDYVANIQKYYIAYQLADKLAIRKQLAIDTASADQYNNGKNALIR